MRWLNQTKCDFARIVRIKMQATALQGGLVGVANARVLFSIMFKTIASMSPVSDDGGETAVVSAHMKPPAMTAARR